MARDLGMWRDGAREDVVRVVRVDPHDLDSVAGDVDGIVLEGCSITEGYYTDTRSSATIRHMGAWGDDLHWLRVVLECPGYGYRDELGTFVVDKVEESTEDGMVATDLTCESVLWCISDDMVSSATTFGAGATAQGAFRSVLRTTNKGGLVLPGAADHRYGSAVVHPVGDSFLKMLFDVAESARDRIDVDGHGRITLGPYVEPRRRDPDWEIDALSPRTVVLSDADKRTTSVGDAAGRSIVRHTRGSDQTVAASADVASSSMASHARRGYLRAELHDESDMQPETWQRAYDLARSYLAEDSAVPVERTIKCMYFPVHEGDVIRYSDASGDVGKYLAKEVRVSLSDMTVDLTLKGV